MSTHVAAPVIAARSVTKRYGTTTAVDGVSLDVRAGEIYALLGLNGAGKTTLIRLLLGMVRPTAGRIEVTGRPVSDRTVWSRVGYLVDTPAAYPELTVRENLEVARRLRQVADRTSVERAIDLFDLGRYADRRARALSLGNRQRLALARAMLHRPSLLVLDEPVNGLDPAGVVEIRRLLLRLVAEEGTTVLLSSHLLSEVARLASRIGVLHDGRLVDELDSDVLSTRVRPRLELRTRDAHRAAQVLREAGLEPTDVDGVLVLQDSWSVGHPDLVATSLVGAGVPPTRLAVTEPDLESYFLDLVGLGGTAGPPVAAAASTTESAQQ